MPLKRLNFLYFSKKKGKQKRDCDSSNHHGTHQTRMMSGDVKNDCVRTNSIVHVKVKSSKG